jgi:hypothetical protein
VALDLETPGGSHGKDGKYGKMEGKIPRNMMKIDEISQGKQYETTGRSPPQWKPDDGWPLRLRPKDQAGDRFSNAMSIGTWTLASENVERPH